MLKIASNLFYILFLNLNFTLKFTGEVLNVLSSNWTQNSLFIEIKFHLKQHNKVKYNKTRSTWRLDVNSTTELTQKKKKNYYKTQQATEQNGKKMRWSSVCRLNWERMNKRIALKKFIVRFFSTLLLKKYILFRSLSFIFIGRGKKKQKHADFYRQYTKIVF
jgi:hypothetical protein